MDDKTDALERLKAEIAKAEQINMSSVKIGDMALFNNGVESLEISSTICETDENKTFCYKVSVKRPCNSL